MVKSLVAKLSTAASSNLSLASTFGSSGGAAGGVQETNYAKHRNDPGRFFGDGVQFKAKLIGILEVGEARGDRMCQEALQDLKMAIRAAGEHKQRITIHVTIDGLRLRDEKTGDSLYHHPVHKISFIAQDMTDSRAFGYIFGSPDSGHRFFGIKTDKAASQVVLAMRDLFQVVFELKKKEIEMARQQIQGKSLHDHASQLASLSSLKSAAAGISSAHCELGASGSSTHTLTMLGSLGASANGVSSAARLGVSLDGAKAGGATAKELSPESVADLVDLEQELTSLQRGITQMERITPNEPATHPPLSLGKSASEDDPFGDSFIYVPSYNILPPPPESGRTRHKPNKTPDGVAAMDAISTLLSPAPGASGSPATLQPDDDDSWLHELEQQNDIFDTTKSSNMAAMGLAGSAQTAVSSAISMAPLAASESTSTPTQQLNEASALADIELSALAGEYATTNEAAAAMADAFTDLDPLGIGRTRPYVDKKYFFQELKNPPKKVLKELSKEQIESIASYSNASSSSHAAATVDKFLTKDCLFEEATAAAPAQLSAASRPQTMSINSSSISIGAASGPLLANVATTGTAAATSAAAAGGNANGGNASATTNTLTTANSQHLKSSTTSTTTSHSYAQTHASCPTFQSIATSTDDFSATKLKLMLSSAIQKSSHLKHVTNPQGNYYTLEPVGATLSRAASALDDPVLLPRDTDPFSPTRKKSDPDPFQEGDLFSKLDAFEFDAPATVTGSTTAAAVESANVFNGPLQVQLPPETGSGIGTSAPPAHSATATAAHWKADISRLERQLGDSLGSTVRTRPTAHQSSGSGSLAGLPPGAALKQQTVEVISSISNKKMPHLFGQARFSKRDSNSSVNMRRLQESDSLSENEAAPEPPPRPDSAPYSEPPPLPPKKQFSEIIIRPHTTPAALPAALSSHISRYEYLNNSTTSMRRSAAAAASAAAADVPPIPLPSRRVGRSDGYFPGPSRPRKPGHTDDDYLAPIGHAAAATGTGDVPPLLPPPTQSSSRARPQRQQSLGKPQDIYENKAEIMQAQQQQQQKESATLAPDITLTQLLTLGIDELASKLNVPASKLSTMTLVELTAYLSEYLSTEQSRPAQLAASPVEQLVAMVTPPASSSSVFKVSFDQQTSFVAKFDDTFGEDVTSAQDSFVANFANFDETPIAAAPRQAGSQCQVPAVPSADRYAVFREIIDQELQQQQQETDLMGDLTPPPVDETGEPAPLDADDFMASPEQPMEQPTLPKIDTKITEVVAQAKDRYAALRDIILVENLFDKPAALPAQDLMQDFPEFADEDQDIKQIMDARASSTGLPDRHGLVDSRGFPAEPSSSALTVDDDDDEDAGGESSLDSNEKDAEATSNQDQYEKLSTSTQQLDAEKADTKPEIEELELVTPANKLSKQDNKFLTVASASGNVGSKDDLEIDELMQRAISNLSLDSRERISPANSTGAASAPSRGPQQLHTPSHFNDVSTSPIPLQRSPQPQLKSAQVSPVPTHLSAVSQLIDTATKQMGERESDATAKSGKETWATFDSPKAAYDLAAEKRSRQVLKVASARSNILNLPPPPPSNTSQQDTAESPCSSDPRDDGWAKQMAGGSGRRWAKKERQQTSSSSRDLSPWDDETPEYLKQQQQRRMPPGMPPQLPHPDRHGYYMRHARRMNSCDEDYDYDEELAARREHQRKFKHGLSRSRDNFDLDSPSWYHHATHHTWSPQEIEQGVRARSFERSAYERSTYGPPIYDKRGNPVPVPPSAAGYERRAAGYDKRRYRDYARPNYDFDDYGEPYRSEASKQLARRTDYENVYDDRRSPMGYKTRGEYIYERDRKSFDRDSVESFESATRRRRSFGSGGDVYGSLDSRDEYRERYLGGSTAELKTRSLRKPTKLRATGDIDYEQDSENDFHRPMPQQLPAASMQQQQQRVGRALDARSLQRPSQLSADVGGAAQLPRLRKSSGSSPWDGEEPTLPGQKSWKRPSSAAETERRLAENRRAAALAQTPSDSEKDRRFRKKTRARSAKDLANAGATPVGNVRYGSGGSGSARGVRENYDYISCQSVPHMDDDDEDYVDDEEYDEEPPTDEDKFERLNRRRHEMHQRMLESERRQVHGQALGKLPPPPLSTLKSAAAVEGKRYAGSARSGVTDYGFVDSYEQTPTPRSIASNSTVMLSGGSAGESSVGAGGKFNFDDGFESDFNQSSPPPAPAGTASSCNSTPAASTAAGSTTKSLFRFSNDFSEREKLQQQQQQAQPHFELDTAAAATPPTITQKLRFDDNVKVSQFEDAAFEDDFAKASFDFDKDEAAPQWNNAGGTAAAAAVSRKQNIRNSKLQQRQELIKKSESVNIFAKKHEDPFEDDEFFKSPTDELDEAAAAAQPAHSADGKANKFEWSEDNNFAKFDENM